MNQAVMITRSGDGMLKLYSVGASGVSRRLSNKCYELERLVNKYIASKTQTVLSKLMQTLWNKFINTTNVHLYVQINTTNRKAHVNNMWIEIDDDTFQSAVNGLAKETIENLSRVCAEIGVEDADPHSLEASMKGAIADGIRYTVKKALQAIELPEKLNRSRWFTETVWNETRAARYSDEPYKHLPAKIRQALLEEMHPVEVAIVTYKLQELLSKAGIAPRELRQAVANIARGSNSTAFKQT